MKLFVLAGKARSGKDSVGKIIKNYYHDKKVVIYSSTYYLKGYVKKITDWDGSDKDKPRSLLQGLGKTIKKDDPDIFIRRMREDIDLLKEYCDIIVVTGVRLVSELEFFRKYGSIIIKVESNRNNGLLLSQSNDVTETDVDKFVYYDYVVHNDGNKDDLSNNILTILKEVK